LGYNSVMSIKNITVNKTSENIKDKRTEELKKILPEVFTEGKIDFEKLKLTLGEEIDERPERFNFTWSGKNKAIKTVLSPSKATLKPAKDESIKFDESENLIIEGDNLEVLKLLQKTYFESIKMIYIDPPYNTGGDFVYHDDFSTPMNSYLKQTGQLDDEGNKQSTNKETNGRYHSDWLSMMYPRLKLAWNLLKDDGVIFVSIDDNEVHNLRKVMDEIFGEENFVCMFVWKTRQASGKQVTSQNISTEHEYVISYQKILPIKFYGQDRDRSQYQNPDNDPRGDWAKHPLDVGATKSERPNCYYELTDPKTGIKYMANENRVWAFSQESMKKLLSEGKIIFSEDGSTRPYLKKFWTELKTEKKPLSTWIGNSIFKDDDTVYLEVGYNTEGTKGVNEIFGGKKVFDYPKPISLIKTLVQQVTKENDLVLDFFGGSGTTAQAVLELNEEDGGDRKFILIQLPEPTSPDSEAYKASYKNIAEITKERVRRVIKGYGDKPKAIDSGFKVFKLAPSNYPEISYEFDPEKTEEENKKSLLGYLAKAKQTSLIDNSVNPIDVVYENIVKEGFSLNSSVSEGKVDGNHIFIVKDGEDEMRISLDKKISSETVKKLSSVEFKGKTFVCYDNALSDSDKANIGLNLELKTI